MEYWTIFRLKLKISDTLLCGFTLLLAIATFLLWLATRDLVRDAEHTAEKQLLILSGQLDEMKKAYGTAEKVANAAIEANNLTRSTFIIGQRPWVFYDPPQTTITSPLTVNENGLQLYFAMFLKNVGHSPAKEVSVWPYIMFLGIKQESPAVLQKEKCESARHFTKQINSVTLFESNSYFAWHTSVNVDSVSMRQILDDEAARKNGLMPFIYGCIDYQSTFETAHHQTTFIWQLYLRNPKSPNNSNEGMLIDPSRSPIPADKLGLKKLPLMGDDAD